MERGAIGIKAVWERPDGAREAWIDVARGIGILLVVAGHVLLMPVAGVSPSYLIFTFHMPLFVFLSSCVLTMEPVRSFAAKRARGLLIPYVVYLALLGVPCLAYILAMQGVAAAAKFALRLPLGGTFLFETFGAFWYVPAIFLALIAYVAMARRPGGERSMAITAVMLMLLAVAYAIGWLRIGLPVPYALHTLPALVVLIWIGRRIDWRRARRTGGLLAAAAVIAVSIAVDLATLGPSFVFDLKNGILSGRRGAGAGDRAQCRHLRARRRNRVHSPGRGARLCRTHHAADPVPASGDQLRRACARARVGTGDPGPRDRGADRLRACRGSRSWSCPARVAGYSRRAPPGLIAAPPPPFGGTAT